MLFDYNPETGVITRRIPLYQSNKYGEICGSLKKTGYTELTIDHKSYLFHRIVWKWMTGFDPVEFDVHHRNHQRSDNRWISLLLLEPSINQSLTKVKVSKHGYRGLRETGKTSFISNIRFKNQVLHLGSFSSPEDAARAYDLKAKDFYGDEAILNFP